MINNLVYLLDYVYEGKEMNVVYIIGIALMAIRIMVPILLIVVASIDLVRALLQNDDKEMAKVIKKLVPKVVIAIVIFILPSLVLFVLKSVNKYTDVEVYYNCLLKPSKCDVKLWQDPPVIVENSNGGGYMVYVRNKNGIYVPSDEYLTEQYLLSLLSDYYTAYYGTTDANSPITPDSVDKSAYSAVGETIGNRKQSAKPITDYVNVDELNNKIGDIVRKYGFGSREAIVAIADLMVTLDDNYTVPYQLGGSYRSNAQDGKSFLGVNSNWGTLDSNGNLVGMDCRNSIIWIYGQDGVSLIRGQAYGGEGRQLKDITQGQPGDVLDSLGHIMLITEKDATGYTVVEENGGGGWVKRRYTFDTLKRSEGPLDYRVYDMSDTINGTNKYINENKTGYGTKPTVDDKNTYLTEWEKTYGSYKQEQPSSSKKQEQPSSSKVQEPEKKETFGDKIKNFFSNLFK